MPAATKLASILDGIVKGNDDKSWDYLFGFCPRCIWIPKRGGHRQSLAGDVNQLISEEADLLPPSQLSKQGSRLTHDPLKSLANRVSCKLEEGDYRGAVRLTCSEDSIVELNEATLVALRSKHLPPHPDLCIPPPPEEQAPTIPKKEVVRAIKSFPMGLGGPDGLRPQHLKDLTSTSAERGGRELLQALTSFVNLVLKEKTPPSVRPFFSEQL